MNLEPPPGHSCAVDERCMCGHTLLAHWLVGDSGQRGCGRDRDSCGCRQFVARDEPGLWRPGTSAEDTRSRG